jgi:hypothetical protein
VEKSLEEILIDLMTEMLMSTGVKSLSTRGFPASPSTAHQCDPSQTMTEKQRNHHNDLANAKLVLSILPDYIPPLDGIVSRDSVPRDFDYTLIIAYLPKEIRVVGP